jgi:GTP cyclohydrolase I
MGTPVASEFEVAQFAALKDATRTLLSAIGEQHTREGLLDTPRRFAEALLDMTSGLHEDPAEHLRTFDSDGYDEIVVVKDIPVRSLCEHHLLPFVGVAHVAYLPAGRIVGLSKLARLVDGFARRLQVQERLTMQVASTLADSPVEPRGVAVVIEAEHMCMTMRGVRAPGTRTTTSVMLGRFREHPPARAEVLDLLRGGPR